jgi:hypothetical protein
LMTSKGLLYLHRCHSHISSFQVWQIFSLSHARSI